MIQHRLNDKIGPVIKCAPSVYTFTTAIFLTTTTMLLVFLAHAGGVILKILFVFSVLSLTVSMYNWAKLVIDRK